LRKQVRSELKALQRRVGIAFVFITHDQEEALSLSDRIAVLNRGRLEQIGDPRDIYLHPASRFTASFLGPVNWIGAVGVRPEATRIAHELPSNGSPSAPATVESSTFLGNCLHVELLLHSGEKAVAEISRLNGSYSPGQPVHLWWDKDDELAL
jgi:ABC-type Fe3+/spermidine/putrescine transport system ATPase subunit